MHVPNQDPELTAADLRAMEKWERDNDGTTLTLCCGCGDHVPAATLDNDGRCPWCVPDYSPHRV